MNEYDSNRILDLTKKINFISTKKVSFDLKKNIEIPKELLKFNPILSNHKLHLSYDKSLISINQIIKMLNNYDISFSEMNTYESNLED